MKKKILVMGSANVDFILKIPRFHKPGETMIAENFVTAYGGKGANQAVAARRLGGGRILLQNWEGTRTADRISNI